MCLNVSIISDHVVVDLTNEQQEGSQRNALGRRQQDLPDISLSK